MSKAIFAQAEKFADRITDMMDLSHFDYKNKEMKGFHGGHERLYRFRYYGIDGNRIFVAERRNGAQYVGSYYEYLSNANVHGFTGVNEIKRGQYRIFVNGDLNTKFQFGDLSLRLTDKFDEGYDFQLSLMLDNLQMKALYIAGILAGRGFIGRVKLDDTIVFTNMLRCMKDEVNEYERLGYFRCRY